MYLNSKSRDNTKNSAINTTGHLKNTSDNELNYFIKSVQFNAQLLALPLSDDQLNLKEPLPVFGIDEELDSLEHHRSSHKTINSQEINFYENVLYADLFTQYLEISRVHQNIHPDFWSSISLNFDPSRKKDKNTMESIEKQKTQIESMAYAAFLFEPLTIEKWEEKLGRLLAVNHTYQFIPLTHAQKTGHAPWVFYPDSPVAKAYVKKIEEKVKALEQKIKILSGDNSLLKNTTPAEKQALLEFIKNSKGDLKKLQIEFHELNTHLNLIKRVVPAKPTNPNDLICPRWHNFFMRGIPSL